MVFNILKIFFIGVAESFFNSFNTKTVMKNLQFLSFIVSMIAVLLWYYVIVMVVEDIKNFWLILAYGCGNGLGDVFIIKFDTCIERIEDSILNFMGKFTLQKKARVKIETEKCKT